MRRTLLSMAVAMAAVSASAQYITSAPEGGFNVNNGKDYVVLYAPENVLTDMGDKVITNNNLDQNQERNYLEYWVTDWDKNAHASLDAFCNKFSNIVDKRYLIYTKDLKKDGQTLLLPVYMTPFL